VITEAEANIHRYPGYYQNLCENFSDQMLSFKKIILLDIRRTGAKEMTEETKDKMLRILWSFSKRNMEIGYCQGMNFICFFLLDMGFTEEQTFWMVCYIFERLMPNNYYVNMIPVIADIELFKIILEEYLPRLTTHLGKLSVDLNFMLIPIFVTAFTNIKNHYVR
jgi:hypothetical protein